MDIRLFFTEMWGGFDFQNNPFINILSNRHNVTIDSSNPNLVISLGKKKYPNALTLYYNAGEPYYPSLSPDIADHFIGSFFSITKIIHVFPLTLCIFPILFKMV